MAVRYSSACTIRVRILDCGGLGSPATYRATVAINGRNVYSCTVGAAPAYRGPVDAPEAFDSVARAGMAFADHDGADLPCYSDAYGYVIFRRKAGGQPCK